MKRTLWSKWVQRGPTRRRLRLSLEILEDRTVPAIFNVGPGDVATLIADLNTANGNGQSNIINLSASTYNLTAINNYWYGPNGLPAIASNLTLHGNGAVQVSAASTGGASGGGAANTPSPPTLFQALLSLYLDAAVLELNNLASEFIHGDNFNIDNFFGTPDQLATVRANAATAGVNYDAIEPLLGGLSQFTGHAVLNSLDDLHFNFPYAGPFAWFAVTAGAQAANQAVQL